MGNLVIDHLTFVFEDDEVNNANSLKNFIDAGNLARRNGDNLHGTETLMDHKYSWGNFYVDFVYKRYDKISGDEKWSWVSQTLHQAYSTFFYQNPSGKFLYRDLLHFKTENAGQNSGTIGCDCTQVNELDVFNMPSWHQWKVLFYQNYPQEFDWNTTTEDFLPNKLFSDKILEEELKKHKKFSKVLNNKIAQAFHDHVVRQKGNDLRAYAIEIGTLVAEANYYKLEEDLSRDEERTANAPRKIFSFVGRNNRKIYISIDHAHGMFEFHDHTGKHLGEYKFDGSHNSGPDATHNLRTI